MSLTDEEQFVVDMAGIHATKNEYGGYELGNLYFSLVHGNQHAASTIRVDGYKRFVLLKLGSPESLRATFSAEQEYAAERNEHDRVIANAIADHYNAVSPFLYRVETEYCDTSIYVSHNSASLGAWLDEMRPALSKPFAEMRVSYDDVQGLNLRVRSGSGPATGSRTRVTWFQYDHHPFDAKDQLLETIANWLENRCEGWLRKVSFVYGNGEPSPQPAEWFEIYDEAMVAHAPFAFKNCKVSVHEMTIRQEIVNDPFRIAGSMFDHLLDEPKIERVYAFTLPEDFEPHGRDYQEVSHLADC